MSLTLANMVDLFGFPVSMKKRIADASSAPTPQASLGPQETTETDRRVMDVDREGMQETVALLERRLRRIERRKMQLIEEMRGIEGVIELKRAERDEIVVERPYPVIGVSTVGFLIVAISLLILFPLELPSMVKYVFGTGFLFIGFSVLVNGLIHRVRGG